ncbi:hypothetical protein Btru_064274 [Bulinus truncatus]|nr:hypothetical protein Btru_064274 [Bulinus truncatus]
MEWNKEEVLRLIQAYRRRRMIWDTKNPLYFNKSRKLAAWESVGYEMQKSAAECKKKMEYLLSALRREKMKMKRSLLNGSDKPYKSSWFAFESLQFLWKKNRPGVTASSEILKNEDLAVSEPTVIFPPHMILTPTTAAPKRKRLSSLEILKNEDLAVSEPTVIFPPHMILTPTTASPKRKRVSASVRHGGSATHRMSHASQSLTNAGEDECYHFGNLVGFKLRVYDDKVRCAIQNDIMNIFLRANQGFYDNIYQSSSSSAMTFYEQGTGNPTPLHGCTASADEPSDRRSLDGAALHHEFSPAVWSQLSEVKQELSPDSSPSPSDEDEN